MINDKTISKIATAFVDARKAHASFASYPATPPQDLTEAYAIQNYALSLWTDPIGGWKVGRINEPEATSLGANRLAGPIFAKTIFDAIGTQTRMPVFKDGFAAAEAEFMLQLNDQYKGNIPVSNEAVWDIIGDLRIGIEIASSPYPGVNADGPLVTISDHGNNAGLVLGQKVERNLWQSLNDIEVQTLLDGELVGTATTATMLDGPFGAVRFLLQNLQDRNISLPEGTWISSGAITGVHEVKIGQTVEARFAGIGSTFATIC